MRSSNPVRVTDRSLRQPRESGEDLTIVAVPGGKSHVFRGFYNLETTRFRSPFIHSIGLLHWQSSHRTWERKPRHAGKIQSISTNLDKKRVYTAVGALVVALATGHVMQRTVSQPNAPVDARVQQAQVTQGRSFRPCRHLLPHPSKRPKRRRNRFRFLPMTRHRMRLPRPITRRRPTPLRHCRNRRWRTARGGQPDLA